MDIKTESAQVVVESTSVAPQNMVLEYGLMRESFSSPYVPIDRHGWSVQGTLPSDIRSYALNDLKYHRFLRQGAIGSFYYHESKIAHFIVVKDCDSEKEPMEFAVLDEYAQHMKKLDPLMWAYFVTPTFSHVEGVFDTETEEWVETTVIILEPPKQIVEMDVCKCCTKALVVQQDMIWMCWYCSPKNASTWRHEKCHSVNGAIL